MTLTLNMSRPRDRSEDITLHRMLANWGEGTSNATREEGRGTPAARAGALDVAATGWSHRANNFREGFTKVGEDGQFDAD